MVDTVIVALPEEDDYVNRISSQKAPHLTLMYLGEEFDMEHLESVVRYIEHIAKTSLYRFGLSVDRRGPLGPKDADVLFFQDGWETRKLKETIGYLLADDHISNAYNSQPKKYDKWTPHLTLGYPDEPAKEDKRDYPGIHYVSFNRIAIWTGDSEGPEFRLKAHEVVDLAMSDSTDLGSSFAEYFLKEEVLEHYGVKGMQWGKRRALGPDGLIKGSTKAEKAPKERGKIRRAITKANTANKAANSVIEEGHSKLLFLPQAKRDQVAAETKSAALEAASLVNKQPRFNGKDIKRDPALKAAYQREVEKSLAITYKNALDKARVEAGMDAISAAIDARRQHVKLKAEAGMSHADNGGMQPAELTLSYEEDELGQIKSFEIVKDSVKHADTMAEVYSALEHSEEYEDFKIVVDEELLHSEEFAEFVLGDDLMHYGVKGMRWGVRKADRVPTGVQLTTKAGRKVKAKGGQFEKPTDDAMKAAVLKQKAKRSSTDSLSNQELKQMIERMQLEANYERLIQQQRGSDMVRKLFTDPKYRNRQVESLGNVTMPVRAGAGAALGVGKTIKKTDLSGIGK